MQITQNEDLKKHSTMRLGGTARYYCEVSSKPELTEALTWAKNNNLPVIMVGGGSNIIWKDEGFDGLLIKNRILGYELQPIDDKKAMLTLGAGAHWDSMVKQTVLEGYYTLAPLSLIPGTVGATPIQNVGAYGQEVSSCIMTILAYDTQENKYVNLRASDCEFGYRTSRFKHKEKDRFFIVSVTFSLDKENTLEPYYNALSQYASEKNIQLDTPQKIRDAVIEIRSSKLPDPSVVANNGSFFANPIVDSYKLSELQETYPSIPHWDVGGDSHKISAAWLIEQAGFKDFTDAETGMATWPKQPLVLVNENAKSTADLLVFRSKLVSAVQEKFGIELTQEPELLPIQ